MKETDTYWMFTLTGTCAEIEDDENVQIKKGDTEKSDKQDPESGKTKSTGKDDGEGKGEEGVAKEGQTTDEQPKSIKDKKLSKDASTETEPEDGDGEEKESAKEGASGKDDGRDSPAADLDDIKVGSKNNIFWY